MRVGTSSKKIIKISCIIAICIYKLLIINDSHFSHISFCMCMPLLSKYYNKLVRLSKLSRISKINCDNTTFFFKINTNLKGFLKTIICWPLCYCYYNFHYSNVVYILNILLHFCYTMHIIHLCHFSFTNLCPLTELTCPK